VRSKQIALSEDWVERHREPVVPLVIGSGGRPLLLGVHAVSAGTAPMTILASRIDELVPSLKTLLAKICEPVTLHEEFPGRVEAYCPDTGSWEHAAVDVKRGAQLLKAQREYFGVSFYVQNLSLGLRVRIVEPEWAFVAAFFLLNWPLSNLVRVEGATLSFCRAVKLPAVMSRSLFAASRALRIDTRMVFEDVHPHCVAGLLGYLTQLGERE
jgi:hypothetical protein